MNRDAPDMLDRPISTQDPSGGTGVTPYPQGVSGLERWFLATLLDGLGRPAIAVDLWNGETVAATSDPVARIRIRDRGALLKLVSNPDLEFGELYSSGRVDVDGDLVQMLEAAYRARSGAGRGNFKERLLARLHRPRRNTVAGSRENIHHHYDIGNAFYRLWLDRQMVYTCAYFPDRDVNLETAQTAKLDYICRKLRLKPGERVVEAGCGWGALALHMARHYGVTVQAFNVSREQLAYARERAEAEGLSDRVAFVERDYREIDGDFDAFVSVGMLEHVGVDHYGELGAVIDRCLKRDGRGLIHSIGRDQPGLMNPWIEKRIFPGARPPSLSEMMAIFEPWGLSVCDVENIRLHYAQTLRHWLARFETQVEKIAMMFDDFFVRMWRLYLAGSIAAFTTGELQLFQVVFSRSGSHEVPWTRAYLYTHNG